MKNNTYYFISPMSKEIVDTVIKVGEKTKCFGLIPTRRQVDFNSGYVNNWKTDSFSKYIDGRVPILRDHGGPDQGDSSDDGLHSISFDARNFEIIHIDPWIKYNDFELGLKYTIDAINLIYSINSEVKYEVLTEEAIRRFSYEEMEGFLQKLFKILPKEVSNNINYGVIQSGVSIDLVDQKNTGVFDLNRLCKMIEINKNYRLLSKEHNGDYLSFENIESRFKNGLDSLNIGPEIAQIETLTILNELDDSEIENWYNNCVKSNKWKRWQTSNFNLNDKRQVIKVCGHYNRVNTFLPDFKEKVKKNLENKLYELYEATK